MNRIYRSVWNEISRTFVAAAETVRGRGKPSSGVCTDSAMTPASRSGAVLARRRPMMLALEQRFMFDGAAVAPVADAAAAAAAAEAHAAIAAAVDSAPAAVEVRAADPVKDGGKKEVVFVDTSVSDYKVLEAGIRDGVAIVEIDGAKDGLAQIAKWAESHSGYDSISILGHGSAATLNLGSNTLTEASLSSAVVQTELAEIGQALTSDGDLMLYGCDVAKGTDGEAFIAALATATGADVAASSDATGAQAKGGDWALENTTGTIDSSSLELADYRSVLSEISFSGSDTSLEGSGTPSITKIVDGSNKTITFSAAAGQTLTGGYGDNMAFGFSSYGINSSGSYVKITAPTGYTFDLKSFAATVSQGCLSIAVTDGNGYIHRFTHSGSGTALSIQSGFESINDVAAVEISSSGTDWFNNFFIEDVKAPPSFTGQYTGSFSDTPGPDSFTEHRVSGTLQASASTATNSPISAYGISGGVMGGDTIDGKFYEISMAGSYGTLYLNLQSGAYVYVPDSEEIEKLSTRMDDTSVARVTRVDSFTVTATDSAGATATNAVSIDITGQNDTPEITSGATATVAENSSGTVYTAGASDRDSGQTLTYKLSGDDAALFNIDASNGKVSFKTAPNYESPADKNGDNIYDITVTATDNAAIVNGFPDNNDSAPKAVHITVTDANDAPSGGNTTVNATEDTPYSFQTGDFSFADSDTGATPHAFSAIELSTLPTAGKLWLDANGDGIDNDTALAVGAKIGASDIAAGKLRFSPAADANGAAYANFSFKVSDGTANATDASKITINVAAVNDAPTGVSISKTTVSTFDSDNTVVETLSATDIDGPTSSFTYRVVSVSLGTASQAVDLFDVSGSDLRAARPGSLKAGTYSVEVEVSDGEKTCQQTLSVTVSDALTVTTAGDEAGGGSYSNERNDGNGLSLREAVALAGTRPGGATIRFGSGVTALTLGSKLTIANDVTFDSDSLTTLTIGGLIDIASGKTLTIANGAGDGLTLSGQITGTGGTLVKTGSGTLTLSGNNNSCGAIRVDGGTLAIANAGANNIGALAGNVRLADATTLAYTAADGTLNAAITLAGRATIDTGTAKLTMNGVISGSGDLVKAGNGTLNLTETNTYAGATRVVAGSLWISTAENIGTGQVSLAGGTALVSVGGGVTLANAVELTGDATLEATMPLTLSGVISGTGRLVKTGGDTLTLTGANRYSGTTTVSAGTLAITGSGTLGVGSVSVASGWLKIYAAATFNNAIALAQGSEMIVGSPDLTLAGNMSGVGALTVLQGKLTLAGANSGSFSGTTTVDGGTLVVAADANLGSNAVTLKHGSTLAVNGTTTIDNAIKLEHDATIAVDTGKTATLSSVSVDSGKSATLDKTGAGTLTLGSACFCSAPTTVAAGTLVVDGTISAAVSAKTGTTVRGNGSIGGTLTVDSGATLAPGAAGGGVGTLTCGGALVLNGTLAVELAGNSSYDAIVANGVTYGTDSAINVTYLSNYAPTGATTFRLIDNRSATSGAFKGLAPGALYKSGDNDYTVSYTASGNAGGSTSLALTSLPRPVVTGVGSFDKKFNKIGDVITIDVGFDRAVNVTGTPTLLLETGAIDRLATYLSGDGSKVLTFSYTAQAGDVSSPAGLDYASTGALTLNDGSIVDKATGKSAVLTLGPLGGGHSMTASRTILIDGNAPSASIALSDSSLRIGETATVTITFSEAVTGFDASDLSVANGSLSGLSSSDGGITWTATFTPTAGISDTSKVITLANAGVTDTAGNAGAGVTASANYTVDTQRPSATIVVADSVLAAGETSQVTITFSEAVTGLTNDDLSVANGTLSGLSSNDGGITWSATLTPTAGVKAASNLITLDNTGIADLAGNAGSVTTSSNDYAVSTARPTATIVVADSALKAGETSLVTITFSEAVTGFTNADLAVANGTLSAVSSSDNGITWSATFTPDANVTDSSNVITLDTAGVTDLAGSAGSGASDSNNYAIDSVRPSATITLADSSLTIGETTQVTITFSEAVTGFTNADLTVANGTLSAVTSSDGGITWSATFTPSADVTDTSNVITLNPNSVENGTGNSNSGAATSANYAVLTARTLSYSATTLAEAAANDGSISSTVTITLANETFSGADGSALGTVGNVPAGLSAQLVKVDATHARLSLTGKASAHTNAQDINNLTVSFADGDFAGSPAAKVAGATTTLAIDFADPAAVPVPPVVDTVVAPPTVVSPPVVVPPPVVVLPPVAVTPSAPVTPVTPVNPQASATPEPLGETVQFIAPTSPLTLAASPLTESTLANLAAPQLAVAAPAPTAALAPAETTRAPAPDAAQSDAARAPATVTASVAENGAPVLTQGGGFQVVVATGSAASPAGDLVVNRGVADQTVASGTMSQFAIPADAFAVSNVGAVVTLTARQSDGAPLPPWVRFDPASGKFEGQPPPGFSGEVSIRVTARDAQGHEAVATFKVKVGEKAGRAQPERTGRAGLAEQLRLAGRPHPALERLARLAAWRNAA